jgi:hypothetical protein
MQEYAVAEAIYRFCQTAAKFFAKNRESRFMKCCLAIAVIMLISSCNGENSSQEIAALQTILDSYHFVYQPWLDVFDCVDMSAANYRFLRSMGYNTSIVIVEDGLMPNGAKSGHCMALVELHGGWACVETKQAVIDPKKSIGKIVGLNPACIRGIYRTPEDIYALDRRKHPVVSGKVIAPNL